jgi:hypothetical protein
MRICRSILAVASVLFVAFCSLSPGRAYAQDDAKKHTLVLTAHAVSQESCAHRPRHETKYPRGLTGEVSFRIHLKIQNVSNHSVILCETCIYLDPPDVFNVTEEGRLGALRWSPDTDDEVKPTKAPRFSNHPDSRFRVIQPGDSFETDRSTPLFLPVGQEWSDGTLRWIAPGPYFLRVSFRPWNQSSQVTDALRRRWKTYGELYSEDLVSMPIAVRLAVSPDSPSCPEY